MGQRQFDKEEEIRKDFRSRVTSDGHIEKLQDRIDTLEAVVAHLLVFLEDNLDMDERSSCREDGLMDF